MEIVPVRDRRGLREFRDLPYRLYRGDPYWVPPLRIAQKELFDRAKHPFYEDAEVEFFLARNGGRTVGRIAAILDRNYNGFHREQAGFFGFFECERDQAAATALLESAREWTQKRGATFLRGPVNPSTNYECGLLVDGFDSSPMVMMTYNPPWYAGLLEEAGLRKAKDLYAFLSDATKGPGERAERLAERFRRLHRVRVRPIEIKILDREAHLIWKVYNSAWKENWGFVPMTQSEFASMAKEMKAILVPELCQIAEVGGTPVGFALALPDINEALKHAGGRLFPLGLLKLLYYKSSIRRLRVLIFGVVREYQAKALAAPLYVELMRQAQRLGYRECEFSWQLEDNDMVNRSVEALGGARYKTYRMYETGL